MQPAEELPRPAARRDAHLLRGFTALRTRNYRLFWIGQLFSITGSWMQTTAQAWLVLQLTRSPFAIGLVATLQFLPMTLFSLFGGVLADRLPKRTTIMITSIAGTVQAAIFGTLVGTGAIQLWHIYALAVLQGLINALDNPTRQAFAGELVRREDIGNAVALNSMQFNTARVVGPALAGILIAQVGIAPALYLNAVSFLAVVVTVLMMKPNELFSSQKRAEGSVIQRLIEGLSYAWRTPKVLQVLIIVAVIGTFGYNFTVMLPLLAGFVLHTTAQEFGMLSAAFGVGSLLAAFRTAYVGGFTMQRLLIASACFSVLLASVALSSIFWLSLVLLAALGFAGVTFGTTANTLVQLSVPDELRGRVMGIYVLLFVGSTPIGAFLIGSLSSLVSVSTTFLVCATLCALGVVGAALHERRAVAALR